MTHSRDLEHARAEGALLCAGDGSRGHGACEAGDCEGALLQIDARVTTGVFAITLSAPSWFPCLLHFLGTTTVLHLLGGAGNSDTNFFSVMLVSMQVVVGLIAAHVGFGRKHRM